MTCQNCGHSDSFVLLIDLSTRVAVSDPALSRLDCSFDVQCPVCESTDVAARPADLLAGHASTTRS